MTTQTYARTQHWPRWRIALWAVVPIVLALPAVAMLFSSEVDWKFADFAMAAVLLGGTALIADRVLRGSQPSATKALLVVAVLAALLLVYAELAVGLVGTPFAGS